MSTLVKGGENRRLGPDRGFYLRRIGHTKPLMFRSLSILPKSAKTGIIFQVYPGGHIPKFERQ